MDRAGRVRDHARVAVDASLWPRGTRVPEHARVAVDASLWPRGARPQSTPALRSNRPFHLIFIVIKVFEPWGVRATIRCIIRETIEHRLSV